jgi:hypothetical protein
MLATKVKALPKFINLAHQKQEWYNLPRIILVGVAM